MRNTLKRLIKLAPAAALCAIGGIAGAQADVLGVSVNGTCEVGSCPAQPTGFGTTNSIPFSFDVTLGNGDLFNFAGVIASDDSSNGLSIHNNGGFTVRYLSGSLGTSHADSLSLDMSFAYLIGVQSGTTGGPQGVDGSFAPGVAAGSSMEFQDVVGGSDRLTLGPFVDPADNPFSATGNFSATFSGGEFSLDNVFTIDFAAGTQAGCSIAVNAPGATCTAVTAAPEPTTIVLLGFGLVGLAALRRRRPA